MMCKKLVLLACSLVLAGLCGRALGGTILYVSFDGPADQNIPNPLISDVGGMEFLPADSPPHYDAESNPTYNASGTSGRFDGPGTDQGLYRIDSGPDDPLDLQNLTAFTIEVFVKATELNERNIVVREYLSYWISLRGDGAVDFYQGDGVGGGGAGEATCNAPAGTVQAGQWYHIAVVFDRSADPNTVMYVDGAEVATGGRGDWGFPDVDDHFAIGVMKRTYNGSRARQFTGLIDELRISNTALAPAEFLLSGGVTASDPSPESGAKNLCDGASLCWKPGDKAQEVNGHDIYLGTDFDDVNDATTASDVYVTSQNRDANCYTTSGLAAGTVYYWRVDEVNDPCVWKGGVWQFTTNDGTAFDPNPEDGQTLVELDAILAWSEGCTAGSHDVYFGTDFDDVNDADTTTSEIFKGNREPNEYDPCDFDYSTWYYWRIDEVDGVTKYKGDVWSFKSRSSITDVNFVAWYKFDETEGSTAYDSSGYEHDAYVAADEIYWDPNDGHDGGSLIFNDETAVHLPTGASGVLGKLENAISLSLWLKDAQRGGDNWVFEAVNGDYRVQAAVDSSDEDILWRAGNDSNDVLRWDLDGQNVDDLEEWHHWAFVKNEDPGQLSIYFDGILADSNGTVDDTLANLREKKLKIGTGDDQAEILQGKADDFRIYDRALTEIQVAGLFRGDDIARAWAPVPRDSTVDVSRDLSVIEWRPGAYAEKHDVYLGTDFDDVNDATTTSALVYKGRQDACEYDPPSGFALNTTYYWRIDEVNTVDPNLWKGRIWKFTTANFIIVDDFEAYDNGGNKIFNTWEDGNVNFTGSFLDLGAEPFDPAHGGNQSMQYIYDNVIKWDWDHYWSEVELPFDPAKDFTGDGLVKVLTLYFYGDPDNDANDTEELYVGLTGSLAEVRYSDDHGNDNNDLKLQEWTEWNIPLSDFSGVDPCVVTGLLIGFGDRDNTDVVGGEGIVYFDNVRLYPPRCRPELGPALDFSGNCIVDWADVRMMVGDWLATDAVVSPITASDPCILHYKFDETSGTTAADASGKGYTGTFFNDLDQTPVDISGRSDPGVDGSSFHFSSPLGYIGVKMPVEVFTENGISQEITVGVWIKNAHPDEDPDGGAFMWEFREWDGASPDANDRVLAVEVTGNGNTYTLLDSSGSASYDLDWDQHTEWQHYAFVRDANNLAIWVSGLAAAVSDSNGTVMATPGLLYVGISADRAPGNTQDMHDGFTGNMDDWKIFDYALSAAQIGYLGTGGTGYVPLLSAYDLYDGEPAGQKSINIRDVAILLDSWLIEKLWPQ
jgi:hypothetical protein